MSQQANKAITVPKGNLIRLQQYEGKRVLVRFAGGRQLMGIMRSFDRGLNLILDHTIEQLPEALLPEQQGTEPRASARRQLGFVIVRGSLVQIDKLRQIHSIGPEEGYDEIENPFLQVQEE